MLTSKTICLLAIFHLDAAAVLIVLGQDEMVPCTCGDSSCMCVSSCVTAAVCVSLQLL